MDTIARVLIVDDEARQAAALSLTLEEQGCETLAVTSAAEGLAPLRSSLDRPGRAFGLLLGSCFGRVVNQHRSGGHFRS